MFMTILSSQLLAGVVPIQGNQLLVETAKAEAVQELAEITASVNQPIHTDSHSILSID